MTSSARLIGLGANPVLVLPHGALILVREAKQLLVTLLKIFDHDCREWGCVGLRASSRCSIFQRLWVNGQAVPDLPKSVLVVVSCPRAQPARVAEAPAGGQARRPRMGKSPSVRECLTRVKATPAFAAVWLPTIRPFKSVMTTTRLSIVAP